MGCDLVEAGIESVRSVSVSILSIRNSKLKGETYQILPQEVKDTAACPTYHSYDPGS